MSRGLTADGHVFGLRVRGLLDRIPRIRPAGSGDQSCVVHGAIIDDAGPFNDKLQEWEDYNNHQRSHGGLDAETPTGDCYRKTAQPVSDQRQQRRLLPRRSAVRWLKDPGSGREGVRSTMRDLTEERVLVVTGIDV
jgi:hypothetical protein